MKKRLIVALTLLVAVASLAVAPVLANGNSMRCYADARGDYQILSNDDDEGAVVRAWVNNRCRYSRYVLVTIVANAKEGALIQSQYTLYLPCHSSRPVDIRFGESILNVNRIIVTPLATNSPR